MGLKYGTVYQELETRNQETICLYPFPNVALSIAEDLLQVLQPDLMELKGMWENSLPCWELNQIQPDLNTRDLFMNSTYLTCNPQTLETASPLALKVLHCGICRAAGKQNNKLGQGEVNVTSMQ